MSFRKFSLSTWVLMAIFSAFSSGAFAAEECSAPGLEEFMRQLSWPGNEFGRYASFDFTESALCFPAKAACERKALFDRGEPGYYGEHSVHFVVQGGRVVFAETSDYLDWGYGGSHGKEGAEEQARAALQKIESRQLCL